jgi:hypothetical protein
MGQRLNNDRKGTEQNSDRNRAPTRPISPWPPAVLHDRNEAGKYAYQACECSGRNVMVDGNDPPKNKLRRSLPSPRCERTSAEKECEKGKEDRNRIPGVMKESSIGSGEKQHRADHEKENAGHCKR